MAEDKKSIIVYADWIDKFEELTDDEAGKLIKHFFRYVNDMNPIAPDRTTKLMFIDIKNTLKRDLNKYSDTKEERSKSGQLGNLKKYQKDLYDKVVSKDISLDEALAIAKSRKVSLSDNLTANVAVSVSGSVSVSDIINNIKQLDFETLFMKLKISPELITKYRSEFIQKIELSDEIHTLAKAKTWLNNWLKMQPKYNLQYLTEQERTNKGLNPKREYVFSTVDGSDYVGLMTDKEKEQHKLDIDKVYSINKNLVN